MNRREKVEARDKRKKRIRKKIFGTKDRPRLCVYKSLKEIYAQIINDTDGNVMTVFDPQQGDQGRSKVWRKCKGCEKGWRADWQDRLWLGDC